MNGPDHYREAERLLADAGAGTAQQAYAELPLGEPPSPLIAAAQVHASLAVAAALAHNITDATTGEIADWQAAMGGGA